MACAVFWIFREGWTRALRRSSVIGGEPPERPSTARRVPRRGPQPSDARERPGLSRPCSVFLIFRERWRALAPSKGDMEAFLTPSLPGSISLLRAETGAFSFLLFTRSKSGLLSPKPLKQNRFSRIPIPRNRPPPGFLPDSRE